MYAHSIPDFALTLTNEPRYFGRIFKTNNPTRGSGPKPAEFPMRQFLIIIETN